MSSLRPLPASVLVPFIPADRRQALAADTDLPDPDEGTALFADISGFTALTGALADAYGPRRGAEELTRHLTRIYDALIDEVHSRNGSVVGFSGDAITCWFGGDDGRAAIAAAHAMQAAMAGLPPVEVRASEATELGLKVAAVHGTVRRFVVGDPAIQRIDALAGGTLDRLARCEALARRGEVVVDASLADAPHVRPNGTRHGAEDRFVVTLLAPPDAPTAATGGWPWLDLDAAEWPAAWVLPDVQDRLRHGLDGQAADFRPATALFLAFGGIDYDRDADAGEKLDAFVRWVQRVVAAWGGAVVQLTLGDKGAYLYACFGAPVAHDDDAARAVAAARTLRAPPQRFVDAVRIGLARGQMYAGTYGAHGRRTFGVLGAKTNLAARLMGLAPAGGVLCDEGVAAHARRAWRFAPLPAMRVKGFDAPVPVFAPDAPVTADPRHARPLVAREREREAVRGALGRVRGGAPATVLIEGEAGLGKSHLMAWLTQEASARGVRPLRSRGPAAAEPAAYAAWREPARELLGVVDDAPVDVRARLAVAAPDLGAWAPLLREVVGGAEGVDEAAIEAAPEVRRRYLARMLAALARHAAGEGAAVLAFDDAHRMDSVSWELLGELADELRESPAPLLLVAAYRSRELADAGARVVTRLRASADAVASLAELPSSAIAELVARELEVPTATVPAALATSVAERAGGNPHYAEEMVAALVEAGTVRVERGDGGVHVRLDGDLGSDGGRLPRTLHGLILARVDRAPAEQRTTLKVAAAVGMRFALPPLRAALPGGPEAGAATVRERLAGLASRGLVVEEGEDRHAFGHALVRDVAYDSMLYAQRRRVHAALAGWYDAAVEMPAGERQPVLAHHYARAAEGSGDAVLAGRAVHHLARAAHQYEHAGAFPEAVDALRRALSLEQEGGEPSLPRAELLASLGAVLEKTGALEEAQASLAEALTLDAPAAIRAATLAGICLVHTRTGRHEEARDAGRRALEEAEVLGDTSLEALIRGRLGILAALDGELADAEVHFDEAQRHYRAQAQPRNAASWLNNLGLARILQERYADAKPPLAEALALAREAQAPDVAAQVLTNLGLAAQRVGDLDEAARCYGEALASCRALRARHDVVTLVVNLGDVALARGEPDEAWRAYGDAAVEAAALGATPKALDALRGAAEVLLARGAPESAARLLGFVLAHPDRNVEVQAEADRVRTALEAQVNEAALAAAFEEGAASAMDDVLAWVEAGRSAS